MPFKAVVSSVFTLLIVPSAALAADITKDEIRSAQEAWGNAIVAIGKSYTNGEDYVSKAKKLLTDLYGYDEGIVLFKPTKAAKVQFRLNFEEALSYFVGGGVQEDHGFALEPWTAVEFENAGIFVRSGEAVAMGNYFFTPVDGKPVKVEYTFGYFKDSRGDIRINLHDSHFPFKSEAR